MKTSTDTRYMRIISILLGFVLVAMGWAIPATCAQQASSASVVGAGERSSIQGLVVDSAHVPVGDASVRLERNGVTASIEVKTDAKGSFVFLSLSAGQYLIRAEKSELRSVETTVLASLKGNDKGIELVLEDPVAVSQTSAEAMEFADKPNFTVAGVTDWTAVGGHGSDFSLRTTEALSRETLKLKAAGAGSTSSSAALDAAAETKFNEALAASPKSFEANHQLGELYLHSGRYRDAVPGLQAAFQIDPANRGNAYDLALALTEAGDLAQARAHIQKLIERQESADLHRLAGEVDEKLADPLAAVHEFEQATRLEPSEQNYFEWGSELLLHRAMWQAQEVFGAGTRAYPKSARMQTALGTALFAGALYDEAALQLCKASDLNPQDPEPYLFMGKVEVAAPKPLACIEQKLARFAGEHPGNSLAQYFYAMAILKRQEQPADPHDMQQIEALLTRAVAADPKCADGYLQLGILDFSRRNLEKAITLYAKAIEANPQLGEAHYRLGVAYDRLGQSARARQEFQLHDEIEKLRAENTERERREVKQFLVVLQGRPTNP